MKCSAEMKGVTQVDFYGLETEVFGQKSFERLLAALNEDTLSVETEHVHVDPARYIHHVWTHRHTVVAGLHCVSKKAQL